MVPKQTKERFMHRNFILIVSILILLFGTITAQTSLTVTPGTPNLDGVISPGEWTSAALVTPILGVTLNAMADGQYLYISASWADSTESIAKKQWEYDGANWSQSGNEDRFAFIWDMGLNGADGPSCVTMCHGDGLMRTNTGKVDTWHWKSARGNAIGYTDDKYFDNVLGGDGGRHGDPGTSAYADNSAMGSGFPSFMAVGDPGANVDFLATDAAALSAFDPFQTVSAHTVAEAAPFDSNTTFTTGNVVPGYLHRIPSGDRASVQAAGKYDNGIWTVEFKRSYAGSDYDFAVVPGSSVDFTHETFDNTGGSHPNDGFDSNVYTLDFSFITAIRDIITSNIPKGFSLKQNYPNPFNPSTKITFDLPIGNKVSLAVFDISGRLISKVIDEYRTAGTHIVEFDASKLGSGVYFYRITTQNYSDSKKMILIK
jgi:hypothetical protein